MNVNRLLSALPESIYGSDSLVAVAVAAVALSDPVLLLYVAGRMGHGAVAQLRDSLYVTVQNVVFVSTA